MVYIHLIKLANTYYLSFTTPHHFRASCWDSCSTTSGTSRLKGAREAVLFLIHALVQDQAPGLFQDSPRYSVLKLIQILPSASNRRVWAAVVPLHMYLWLTRACRGCLNHTARESLATGSFCCFAIHSILHQTKMKCWSGNIFQPDRERAFGE